MVNNLKNIELLKKLVERATPEEPKIVYDGKNKQEICPNCEMNIKFSMTDDLVNPNFCVNCGKALDFSEVEEFEKYIVEN